MRTIYLVFIVVCIIVGGVSFFAGLQVGKGGGSNQMSIQDVQKLSPEERQKLFQGARGQGGPGARGARVGDPAGFVSGKIMSKDDTSVTITLRDGGTKLVFFSNATAIGKQEIGTAADLETGKQVTISGKANADGSLVADSIQISLKNPVPDDSTPDSGVQKTDQRFPKRIPQ